MKPSQFAHAVRHARSKGRPTVGLPRWMALARQLAADVVTGRSTYAAALERIIHQKVERQILASIYTELCLELRRLGGNPK
jgi:hypothetical protein